MAFAYSDFDVDLSDADSALTFVTESLALFGLTPGSDAALRLAADAGRDADGVTVYRPYALMASLLARAENLNHINSAGGATFRDADKTIAEWRAQQASLDLAFGLTLPPGAAIILEETYYSGPVGTVFRA